jgi:hypothetical protein
MILIPKIDIAVIPISQMRYPDVGDWYDKRGKWLIRVAKMECRERELAVIQHELAERFWAAQHGVTWQQVDEFAFKYWWMKDPGSSKKCPCREGHLHGLQIEKKICRQYGLDWKEHEVYLENLILEHPNANSYKK